MNRVLILAAAISLGSLHCPLVAQEAEAPKGLRGESKLGDRYPCVVQDALKYCRPEKGFWVDLGAGKAQLTIPLVEATGNPVTMLDPNVESLSEGLKSARENGLADRISAVVGAAEALPFPDNSVDFVVSRGSIFFWDDQAKGLREVYRVLRPGGKAYIGGGAGSSFPKDATEKLIQDRKEKMQGDEVEKWQKCVASRRPEQMQAWAEAAGLADFQVMGKGAVSADDPRVGQGVWLVFEKKPEPPAEKKNPG
jgi:SAM-dependent methyltransferase